MGAWLVGCTCNDAGCNDTLVLRFVGAGSDGRLAPGQYEIEAGDVTCSIAIGMGYPEEGPFNPSNVEKGKTLGLRVDEASVTMLLWVPPRAEVVSVVVRRDDAVIADHIYPLLPTLATWHYPNGRSCGGECAHWSLELAL